MGNFKKNKDSNAFFVLENTGSTPLNISNVVVSCGCIIPEWDKKSIKPGEKTKIKAIFDIVGYFRKSITFFL